jgi:DNA-directed RNA polymerase I subunit RPA1
MSHGNEVASSSVESVRFSFMTDEEVKKHSLVKITNPILLDSVERPIPGGLYDPALGSLDENTPCKTCGQRSIHCPGHCGHIDLVSPLYNPLLFDLLYVILSRTCFLCFHFRDEHNDVEKVVTQLKMIAKGDITGAKQFAEAENSECILSEDSDGSNVTNSWSQDRESENHKQQSLTSLQFSEARSVLIKFLKQRSSKCKNCESKNPKITKPTFGWLHMKGLSGAYSRSNIIRSSNLERPGDDDDDDDHDDEDDRISSEVDNSNSTRKAKKSRGKKAVSAREENDKQKAKFSGPLLPSEV